MEIHKGVYQIAMGPTLVNGSLLSIIDVVGLVDDGQDHHIGLLLKQLFTDFHADWFLASLGEGDGEGESDQHIHLTHVAVMRREAVTKREAVMKREWRDGLSAKGLRVRVTSHLWTNAFPRSSLPLTSTPWLPTAMLDVSASSSERHRAVWALFPWGAHPEYSTTESGFAFA